MNAILLILAALTVTPTQGLSPLTIRIECETFVNTETIVQTKQYVCRPWAEVTWIPPTMNEPDDLHLTQWPLTDLKGYKLYYGSNPDLLDRMIDIKDPKQTSLRVDNLEPGKKWYFSITAYNSFDLESRRSGLASIQL